MRVRVLAATAAVLCFAGLAPAQWSIAPAPRSAPTTGLVGTMLVTAGYPSGWAVGYDYARLEAGVKSPAGDWYPAPAGRGWPTCVSAGGEYAAGPGYRWHLPTGAVEPVADCRPQAIAADGAMVVSAVADGWLVGGVVHPGRADVVVVPCQFGYLAPGWGLYAADTIEPNGDGTYTVTGGGSLGGFVLTGPLPE